MAKKKEKPKDDSWIKSMIADKGPDFVVGTLKGFIDKLTKSITDSIHNSEKKFMQTLVYYILFAVGAVLLAAGGIILISEYFEISKGWIYFGAAIILILWSWHIKNQVEKM